MSTKTFRTGQRVKFQYSARSVRGVIREDRGPIGREGRVLYLIEFRPNPQSPDVSHIELPAEKLKAIEDTAAFESS